MHCKFYIYQNERCASRYLTTKSIQKCMCTRIRHGINKDFQQKQPVGTGRTESIKKKAELHIKDKKITLNIRVFESLIMFLMPKIKTKISHSQKHSVVSFCFNHKFGVLRVLQLQAAILHVHKINWAGKFLRI